MKPAIFSSLQYKACNKQMSTSPILDLRDFLIENNAYYYDQGLKDFLREENISIEIYVYEEIGKRRILVENDLRYHLLTSEKLDTIIVSFEGSNFVIHSINRIVFYGNRDYFVAVEPL